MEDRRAEPGSPPPSVRDAAIAWVCALAAGLSFAVVGIAMLQPILAPPDCIPVPDYTCPAYVAPPLTAIMGMVAMTSGLQGVIVLGLVRRRLALRREGRTPHPPLWASLTSVAIVGLFVELWLGDLVVVLVTS